MISWDDIVLLRELRRSPGWAFVKFVHKKLTRHVIVIACVVFGLWFIGCLGN